MLSAQGRSNTILFNELSIVNSGHNLIISWQADKTAFDHFEVERSLDGKNFSTIGLVLDAPENTNTCMFKDKKLNKTNAVTIWYRIKAINKDGSMVYSSSSSYTLEKETVADYTVSVSPNPFNNTAAFKIAGSKPGFAEIRIQNLAGETLLSKQSTISKGSNTILVDGMKKLNSGIYMAVVTINGIVVDNQRVVKD